MKVLLKEGAYYSEAYQRSVDAGGDEIRIPKTNVEAEGYTSLKRSIYGKILRDHGYFSGIGPLKRISLAGSMLDMGEYLMKLHEGGRLNARMGRVPRRMIYFAPCHQREQQIGNPYEKLLSLVPGLTVERVGGTMDCCGMGGSLGFKESFYQDSIALGRPLMRKIEASAPQMIVTDCLSCRLQFEHSLPYPVFHPLEILSCAYAAT
jgi:glycerol-3-phosphate dehydrogenase subunit C